MVQGEESRDEVLNRLFSIIILTCYNQINIYQSEDILAQRAQDIQVLSGEYKELLGLDKWNELFRSGDQEVVNQEMGALGEALREIQSEVI